MEHARGESRVDLRLLEDGAALKVVKIEAVNGWPTKLQVLLDNGIGLGGENLGRRNAGNKQDLY